MTQRWGHCLRHTCSLLSLLLLCAVPFGPTEAAGRISGTVTDEDSLAPIPGIIVCLFALGSPQPLGCNQTLASGQYTSIEVPDGDYVVLTAGNLQGDVREFYDNVPFFESIGPGDTVTVDGTDVGGIDFALQAGFTVTGTVVDQATNAPLAGIQVCLFRGDGTQTFVCSGTDDFGTYMTPGVPVAGKDFAVWANGSGSGYASQSYAGNDCPSWEDCDFTFGTLLSLGPDSLDNINFALPPLFGEHPLDGQTAMDIQVAAAVADDNEEPELNALCGGEPDSLTGFALGRVDFVELRGRPGHEGYFPIAGEPLPGDATVLAEIWGEPATHQFRLLDDSGALLGNIDLGEPSGSAGFRYFLGTITVPNEPFRVQVQGTDGGGAGFELTCPRLFQPRTVDVVFNPRRLQATPGPVALTATVINHGPAQTFDLTGSNSLHLPMATLRDSVNLAEDGSATVTVVLHLPAISTGVLSATVRLEATGTTNPDATNHGESIVQFEWFELLGEDGFETRPAFGDTP